MYSHNLRMQKQGKERILIVTNQLYHRWYMKIKNESYVGYKIQLLELISCLIFQNSAQ